jgi:hypothetical protein
MFTRRDTVGGYIGIDNNGNSSVNSISQNYTSTALSATTTLTATSTGLQYFTGGSSNQLLNLPNATTLQIGRQFQLVNNGDVALIIRDGASTQIGTVPQGSQVTAQVTDISTSAGSWVITNQAQSYSPMLMQLRLTDQTNTPLGANLLAGSNTVFATPYLGNQITLWNNPLNRYVTQTFVQTSLSMIRTAGIYDIYAYPQTSSTIILGATAWVGNTRPTRIIKDGRLLSSDSTGTLLGIVQTNGTNTFSNFGQRWIINYFNQISLGINCALPQATVSYTYNSATIRPINSNSVAGAGRFSFIFDSAFMAQCININCFMTAASTISYTYGIGINSTTVVSNSCRFDANASTSGFATCVNSATTGSNFLQQLEFNVNVGTSTITTYNATAGFLHGMHGYMNG